MGAREINKKQVANSLRTEKLLREQLVELLEGGFAPNVILLREFTFDKAGKDPDNNPDVWPEAPWPENHTPATEQVWLTAIASYEKDLADMIALVQNYSYPLLQVQKNGKTFSWAAMTALHHTGYHIGQLKTIGRQLGVW